MCERGSFIIFCAVLFLCFACAKEQPGDTNLQAAMQTVDEHPQEALRLLDEILRPELTDCDNYMHYVVTLTQARYMDYQDITGDTLILEAQRYFSSKDNPEMATRASFYAAAYWHEKGVEEKTLEYSLLTHYYAGRAGNNLFRAKSAQWIGSAYFDLKLLDSAKIYYHEALKLFNNEYDSGLYVLSIKYMLGRTYRELEQFDQAYTFLESGLESAKKMQNKEYELQFLNNLGMIYTRKKAYQQAKDCFNQALSLQSGTEEDIARVYLNYARLYKAIHHPDSIQYYLKLVEERIPQISYPYTRRAVYQELALYHKSERNIYEMEHFLNLKNKEELLIKDLQSEKKMQAANERFETSQRKIEQAKQQYSLTWKISLTVVAALLLIQLIFWRNRVKLKARYKDTRKRYITHKLYMEEYMAEHLNYISAGIKELSQEGEPVLPHLATWKHFQHLRTNAYIEIEAMMREMFQKMPRGFNALSLLKLEDLCIIFLYRRTYSAGSIKSILGYEHDPEYDVEQRKHHIRELLATAGFKKREINSVFLERV